MSRLTRANGIAGGYAHDNLPAWMFFARIAQFLLALLELGLNGYLVSKKSIIGANSYTGLNMFTAIITMIAISYVVLAPKHARNFYHVWGEAILEFLLAVFWLSSFACLASWISALDNWGFTYAVSVSLADCQAIEKEDSLYGDLCDSLKNVKTATSVTKAAVVFGAFLFVITLANFIFLVVYIVRSHQAGQEAAPATAPADTEMAYSKEQPTQTVTAMPPGFAGHETHA